MKQRQLTKWRLPDSGGAFREAPPLLLLYSLSKETGFEKTSL